MNYLDKRGTRELWEVRRRKEGVGYQDMGIGTKHQILFHLSFSALPRTRAPCVLVFIQCGLVSLLSDPAGLV